MMVTSSQTTIAAPVALSGVGVHMGDPATIVLQPAASDNGIVFAKTDRRCGRDIEMSAQVRHVVGTSRCTVLGSPRFGEIATVEHLMAALGGLGVDNVLVEVDGGEIPIMDGSAEPFVEAIASVGLRRQAARRRYIRVLKPVQVEEGAASAELRPHAGRRIEIEIDFESDVIGRQAYVFDFERGDFRGELARARTFGFMRDVEGLWSKGLALGASLDNTVVLNDDAVVNPEGLRFSDEFVRHKALDAVGDLTLAGAPILGLYRSVRGGHRLNCAVVETLLADPDAWTWAEFADRRDAARADVGAMMPAAAFGPDVS